jgi:predicted ribosome quality control (RQC) complex YloA/Tae2 family protein
MLLRKHLTGAKIFDLFQPTAERVLIFKFETLDALGVKSEKRLIVELIGRQSNVILCDSDGLIIDCLRRVGGELNDKRSVLPGLIYRSPPAQEGKRNPLDMTEDGFNELLKQVMCLGSLTIEKWLISTFTAFSPLICREVSRRAYGDVDFRINNITDNGDALCREFISLINKVNAGVFEPWLIFSVDCKPYDFSFTLIKQYEEKYVSELTEGFSYMLDEFFTRSAQENRISQRSLSTLKSMTTARDRLVRKLAAQRMELIDTSKRDYFRECGDIISANLHLIKKGQQLLVAEDFYLESGGVREIKLDPLKTPQQNAAKYYKTYTKSKNAQKYLDEQIKSGERELEYIKSVIEQIRRIENEHDLEEVRNELTQTGYLKKQKQHQKQLKSKPQKARSSFKESAPHSFVSSSEMRIFAGKNNIQNDRLTLKSASKYDIWLHAQKIHGAHVIISCAGAFPDETTLQEAASIAAYYSAAREDTKVPIDYTYVKNVKKPPGGRPGMVIYNDYNTILANPDEGVVRRLSR